MSSNYDHETGEIIEPGRGLPAAPAPTALNNLIFASGDCAAIFGALAAAQGKMGNPKKTKEATVRGQTKNGGSYDYKYKYAPLEEVVDAIRKPMSDAKLVYRQFLASREGQWVMRTIIAHESGQWFGCDYPIFTGRQEGAQGFASGVTYARRYGLMLALGIVAEDDDDTNVADGNPAQIGGGGAGAQVNGSGTHQHSPSPRSHAPRPSAAPADGVKDAARTAWRIIRDAIDAAETIPEIDAILASNDWGDMHRKVIEAEAGGAGGVINQLVERADRRKALLTGDAEPELHSYEV